MADQTSRYDDLTDDDLTELRDRGASEAFIRMAQYDDGGRNSVRENADRVLDGYVNTEGELSDVALGHFGKYMWQGDLYHAFRRADKRNTRIMVELFGLERINEEAREQGKTEFEKRDDRYVFASG